MNLLSSIWRCPQCGWVLCQVSRSEGDHWGAKLEFRCAGERGVGCSTVLGWEWVRVAYHEIRKTVLLPSTRELWAQCQAWGLIETPEQVAAWVRKQNGHNRAAQQDAKAYQQPKRITDFHEARHKAKRLVQQAQNSFRGGLSDGNDQAVRSAGMQQETAEA